MHFAQKIIMQNIVHCILLFSRTRGEQRTGPSGSGAGWSVWMLITPIKLETLPRTADGDKINFSSDNKGRTPYMLRRRLNLELLLTLGQSA